MKILKFIGRLVLGLIVLGGVGLYWMSTRLEPDVEVGSQSPDVTLATLEGEALALSSLRGKVVLLEFWGST